MTYNHIYVSKDTLSGLQSQTNDSFPHRLDKDIAGNDPVRVVDAVIDNLKLENFRKLYKERGRSPYHPKMMLKAVIYGYMNNLYSCRKIESALKRDIHFIWLAGYEQPDFNTINRFRNRVKEEINHVFTQLVIILAEKDSSLLRWNILTVQKSNRRPTNILLYGTRLPRGTVPG